jgi:hypothetical protein
VDRPTEDEEIRSEWRRFFNDVFEEQRKARESRNRFLTGVAIQALGTIVGGAVLALAAALVGIIDFVGRLAAGLSLLAIVAIIAAWAFFAWRTQTELIEDSIPRLLDVLETHDFGKDASREPPS